MTTLDPFGGPGGWAEGLRSLDLTEIGIEYDPSACATRAAAGHRTIRADVRRMPLDHLAGKVEGLILSPPCQTFSTAGKGEGRAELARLRKAIDAGRWAAPIPGAEVLEVGRWAETLRPRWIACEQVSPVLPLWKAYARRWRALYGWSCWAGLLCAADYGVPQTRTRAFLMARTDGRPAHPPAATHTRGGADTLFGGLAPWVSMAEALGWVGEDDPARTLCGDRQPRWMYPDRDGTHGRAVTQNRQGNARERIDYERSVDEPSPTLVANADRWVLRGGPQANATVLGADEPAPTILASADNGGTVWQLNRRTNSKGPGGVTVPTVPVGVDRPAPTVTAQAGAKGMWQWERPATTIAGDARCWPPGHKVNADDRRRPGADEADARYGDRAGTDAVKLTVAEALVLQSFRPDYPVQGTKTKQFEQVGNAVPPLLAAHVVAELTGRRRATP